MDGLHKRRLENRHELGALPVPSEVIASSLDLPHLVYIQYPASDLLKPEEGETLTWMRPNYPRPRHEPLPLVPDAAVMSNTFRDREDQDIVTISRATADTSDLSDPGKSTFEGFLEWMKLATSRHGKTELRCLLVKSNQAPFRLLRIATKHYFPMPGGVQSTVSAEYAISLYDFMDNFHWNSVLWYRDIKRTIHLDGHRAYYGTRTARAQIGMDGEILGWKAPRRISISDGIPKIVHFLGPGELEVYNQTLPDDEKVKECNVCLEEFGTGDQYVTGDPRPVLLPCSKKHIVHFECFETWCRTHGLTETTCFWCRVKLVDQDSVDARMLLPNYADIDVPYEEDPAYDEWENSERAFADLDRSKASENREWIVVSSTRLSQVWEHIMESPSTQFPEPRHLLMETAPEMEIVTEAWATYWDDHDGEVKELCALHALLLTAIYEALRAAFLNNRLGRFMSGDDLARLQENAERVPLRPGLAEFFKCALNRLLNFQIVRQCDECGFEAGLHRHGMRVFHHSITPDEKARVREGQLDRTSRVSTPERPGLWQRMFGFGISKRKEEESVS